nr:BEL1-like homeodomain protein 1 [Ipomoea trifida]
MATYFHGNSEIQAGGDGLQTLILMNPAGYVGFSDAPQQGQPPPGSNFIFLNSNAPGSSISFAHAPPTQSQQQYVGIPLATTASAPPSTQDVHAPSHDITALHGFLGRPQYNLYAPPIELAAAREVTRAAQQGLSLSLSSQQPGFGNFRAEREVGSQQLVTAISPTAGDEVRVSGGSPSSASGVSNGVNGVQSVLLSSKFLKAAQELLEEVVNVGKGVKAPTESSKDAICPAKNPADSSGAGDGQAGGESSGKRATELTTAERQEIQMKKAKLVNMLDEVEQRYRQYHHQMQIVITWFEQAAGIGSAKTYTALALQTISKQFRCLKDAILGQIRAASKSLGEEDGLGGKIEGSSRLKFVDNQLRQQRALQQLGMIQHNAWRPQRGLPERSVSVLRAWLFEHFLHPYPKDSDKIMLAKQTGLTRNQVSNWFINARVRLWKPMVEEMYMEEIKEQEQNGSENKTGKGEPNEDSASHQDKSPGGSDNQDKSFAQNQSTTMPGGFNLIVPSEMESITQGSPKKPRSTDMLHSPSSVPSISIDTKPADPSTAAGNEQGSMKFMNDRQNREGFTLLGNSTNFMGGFGSYPIGEIGRFSTEQFPGIPPPYSGNAVSLTLGLPPSENLPMSATHHAFLPAPDIHMGRGVEMGEANEFGGMTTPTSAHPTSVYESFNLQNRKRFAAPLLPDFVA